MNELKKALKFYRTACSGRGDNGTARDGLEWLIREAEAATADPWHHEGTPDDEDYKLAVVNFQKGNDPRPVVASYDDVDNMWWLSKAVPGTGAIRPEHVLAWRDLPELPGDS